MNGEKNNADALNIKGEPEILAPAGSLEQLKAAVACGADAVYFGTPDFNARRNASNFGGEEFLNAVKYCCERGVKSYITLNTLVREGELDGLYSTVRLIAQSGADAVIIQDMAAYKIIRECCPALPLHASTQMAVHNAAGAALLEKLGFKRIVLARELSLKEIARITQSIDIETEIFVHGALCMSASGMCYMSSFFGARSGNRGLCAQPCRLNFRAARREYALSLKDMSLLEHIEELKSAGVSSLKIEGRMKRPEYAAAAVTACRAALSGEKPDMETLKSVFSRGGFTDGYFTGSINSKMFGRREKEDVCAAAGVLPQLSRLYKDERKRIPISMRLVVRQNEPARLTVSDGEHSVRAVGDIPQAAVKLSLNAGMAEKSLLKLGKSFYYPNGVECDIENGLMLSAAAINALRREAVEKLSAQRGAAAYAFKETAREKPAVIKSRQRETRLYFTSAKQLEAAAGADKIILPLSEIEKNPCLLNSFNITAALPALIYPAAEKTLETRLCALAEKGLRAALCENIGAVFLAKRAGLAVHGGHLLNVLNSEALSVYESCGVTDCTLSAECSFEDMKKISGGIKTGFIAYGHMPLMHFRCCPLKKENGCENCRGGGVITDRRNEPFRLLCHSRQYSAVYNPVPLYTGGMKMPQLDFATLMFTYETAQECAEIISCFEKGLPLNSKRTAGLYDKSLL